MTTTVNFDLQNFNADNNNVKEEITMKTTNETLTNEKAARKAERKALRRGETGLVHELCGHKLSHPATRTVCDGHSFEKIQSRVKRIYNEEYDIPALYVHGNGRHLKTYQGIQPVPANYITPLIEKQIRPEMLYRLSGAGKNVRRCFMGQMYLVLENDAVFNGFFSSYGVLGKIVAVHVKRRWIYALDVPGVETVKIVSKHPFDMKCDNPDVRREWLYKDENDKVRDRYEYDFRYALCSPGAKKKNGIMLWGNYIGEDESRKFSVKEIIDLATCGSWSMQQFLHRGVHSYGAADTAKLGSRYSQILAPQSVLMDTVALPSVLFLGGKQKIDFGGKEIEACDGIGYLSSAWFAFALNQMAEYRKDYITEGAVSYRQIQMRPWTMKGTSITLPFETMNAVLKQLNYILKKGLVIVNGDTCNLETRVAVYNFTVSGGKEGKFKGKGGVLVVYPSELEKFVKGGKQLWPTTDAAGTFPIPMPALIADANCIKTGVDPKFKSGGRFMNMSHCHKFEGSSSVQTLQSLAYYNYEATKTYVAQASQAMVDAEDEKIFGKNSRALTGKDFTSDGRIDWMSAAQKIAPALYNECGKPAFMKSAEKSLEGLSTKFQALNFTVPNVTQMLMPDLGALLFGKPMFNVISKTVKGKVVTDIAEVYTTTLEEHTEGIMYRFPKCGVGEFVKVRNLSKKDILSRYEGIEREIMSEVLNGLGAGIISIPVDPYILNALGGADFDGDKVKVFIGPVIDSDEVTTEEDLVGFEYTDFGILCDVATIVVDKDPEK